ncbi:unnamed protein product [Allacma fusca]|uniref:Uncharacterized protein n=1 Tax=Allacma fusca TaxID=39272 RepID=A0A8J2J9P0_9HEXA|nr:unnamed protein product [Allacma fusca]
MASYPLDFSDRTKTSSTPTLMSKMTWSGFEEELLSSFEEFWRLGDFVDVTLICDDLTLRAHRIVLAANSEYFERIFTECDCKNPVILLHGFEGWEVEACVEFMYRGVIQVPSEKVNDIVNTAGILEIRSLADYVSKLEDMAMSMRMPLPLRMTTGDNRVTTPTTTRGSSVIMTEESLEPNMAFEFDSGPRSPKCLNLSMGGHLNQSPQTAPKNPGTASTAAAIFLRHSPLRRKQARPRRRSGDYVAQDLRKINSEENQVIDYRMTSNSDPPLPKIFPDHHQHQNHDLSPIIQQPSPPNNNNSDDGISSSNCVISPPSSPPFFFPKASPPSPEEGHACSTPPIFPPFTSFGNPGHWPGLPLGPAPIFGRHRAQHSAPRGGPPRAWSNADLTEALHNVWNKKMTTSQASRIFGIPYNSLLMYVRGKYGKSLKLDLLKKGLDMAMENKNNNKSKPPETHTPEFNPFAPGPFGEFPPPFPFATALSHILPGIEPKIDLGKTEDMK